MSTDNNYYCSAHSYIIQTSYTGVYTFEMLTGKTCRELMEEVRHFEQWCKASKLRINRPNSMNKYGAILDDFGFQTVLNQ